tara:strand:- start:55153 stop:56013 length:861 start_codon:yes stop_codon:yes gene_type:complete
MPTMNSHAKLRASPKKVRVIEPASSWLSIDWMELWDYRDLLYFLVWRDIKVRYAQSALGIGWAVIQPVFFMIVFTFVFGELAKIDSDGVPYPIFSFAALVPWTYFATSMTGATESLISNARMLSKVYFPRLMMPFSAVLARLIDFAIALLLLLALMVWFKTIPSIWALILPVVTIIMILSATGAGMWLTALAIQYRDIKYGISFAVQLLMFTSPVVYPASLVPDEYRLVYAINPMVGVIESFRSALLTTNPMPWDLLGMSILVATILFISGLVYFRRTERIFADVA